MSCSVRKPRKVWENDEVLLSTLKECSMKKNGRKSPRIKHKKSTSLTHSNESTPKIFSRSSSLSSFPVKETKEIENMTYYSLLKKTDVLGHLMRMNEELNTSEAEKEQIQREYSRIEKLSEQYHQEWKRYQNKYENLYRIFMEHLLSLTTIGLQEEGIRLGHAIDRAISFSKDNAKSQLDLDLSSAQRNQKVFGDQLNLEHIAMATVSERKLKEIESSFSIYRMELQKAELKQISTEASNKTGNEHFLSLEKEIMNLQDEKSAMEDRLYRLETEYNASQRELYKSKEEIHTLKLEANAVRRTSLIHTDAVEKYTDELRDQVKKRFGFVPASLDYYCQSNLESRIPTVVPAESLSPR